VRRMLGELELLVHFAEARRGKNDDEWREEWIKMLAKAVEGLSGGRIAGDHAERLARLIIRYAERREERAKKRIENLAKEVGVSREEVWGVVERVLSGEDPYVYCLARNCARDEVVRKFVEPALELMMLDKVLRGEFDREEALLIFGEMYATAVAGDGHVGPNIVVLAVGGELGRGAALLRLATLYLLNQLLPNEFKFYARIYVGEGVYNIAAYGGDAARFKRLLAVSASSAGGEYLSEKFEEFMKDAQVEVRVDNIRLTKSGVAADLTISEGGIEIKYNVYLRRDILLRFRSTDRSRVELAARLLRLAGISAEVKRVSGRDVWQVWATTYMLAAGRKELRDAVRKVVEGALERGGVDEKKAEGWLEKLEGGVAAWEGKKCEVIGERRVGGALPLHQPGVGGGCGKRIQGHGSCGGRTLHCEVKWGEGPRLSSGRGGEAPRVGLYTRRRGTEAEGRGVPQIPRALRGSTRLPSTAREAARDVFGFT